MAVPIALAVGSYIRSAIPTIYSKASAFLGVGVTATAIAIDEHNKLDVGLVKYYKTESDIFNKKSIELVEELEVGGKFISEKLMDYYATLPKAADIPIAPTVVNTTNLLSVLSENSLRIEKQLEFLNKSIIGINTHLSSLVESVSISGLNSFAEQSKQNNILSSIAVNISALSKVFEYSNDLSFSNIAMNGVVAENIENVEKATKQGFKDLAKSTEESGDIIRTAVRGVTTQLTNSDTSKGLEAINKTLEKTNAMEDEKDITYNGTKVNKRELEVIRLKEEIEALKSENSFDMDDITDFVEDMVSDGFDLDYNPFEVILNRLKDEFTEDFKEKKTKYNIKSVGEI
ncbi:hypothetical protein AFAEC_1107 [Aliarcobacter faecis]|uniref:hypothetical protein n=1 Tax=Aliarcobacter faecis TaxID=1564138 RepID=UPI0004797E0D|nr:hypothetical protein [Aliarcobacter faecis]QKF73273.1 hypothetical protein AFAEC_1107 [Aliarcobacter faecis]